VGIYQKEVRQRWLGKTRDRKTGRYGRYRKTESEISGQRTKGEVVVQKSPKEKKEKKKDLFEISSSLHPPPTLPGTKIQHPPKSPPKLAETPVLIPFPASDSYKITALVADPAKIARIR